MILYSRIMSVLYDNGSVCELLKKIIMQPRRYIFGNLISRRLIWRLFWIPEIKTYKEILHLNDILQQSQQIAGWLRLSLFRLLTRRLSFERNRTWLKSRTILCLAVVLCIQYKNDWVVSNIEPRRTFDETIKVFR